MPARPWPRPVVPASTRSSWRTRPQASNGWASAETAERGRQCRRPPRGGLPEATRYETDYFLTASAALLAASLTASAALPAAAEAASVTAAAACDAAPATAALAPAAPEAAASTTAEAAAATGAVTAAAAAAGAAASSFLPQAARATAATREASRTVFFILVSSNQRVEQLPVIVGSLRSTEAHPAWPGRLEPPLVTKPIIIASIREVPRGPV